MSDDPVDGMQVGETQRLSDEFDVDPYEAAWDEFVGFDREVENIEIEAEMLDDEKAVVTVSGDVTKVDPNVKPVFQTEDRWNRRSDVKEPTPQWKKLFKQIAPHAITLATVGACAFVAQSVVAHAGIAINGEQIAAPGLLEMSMVLVPVLFILWGVKYLPGAVNGGRL